MKVIWRIYVTIYSFICIILYAYVSITYKAYKLIKYTHCGFLYFYLNNFIINSLGNLKVKRNADNVQKNTKYLK